MAPTICTEKESSNMREGFRKNRFGHHILGTSKGGKIIHRRSISSRNAFSKLTPFRLPNSESSSSSSSSLSNDNDSQNTTKNSIDEEEIQDEQVSMNIEKNCNISSSLLIERLSYLKEIDTSCKLERRHNHNYLHNFSYHQYNTKEQQFNNTSVTIVSDDDISSSFSSSPSILNLDQVIETIAEFPQRKGNTKKLLEIAVKTIKLMRRNQMLQRKLSQLQFETRLFIESVMANPENQALRPVTIEKIK